MAREFQLAKPPLLSSVWFDRLGHLRANPVDLWRDGQLVRISGRGGFRVVGRKLSLEATSTLAEAAPPNAMLVGAHPQGPLWVLRDDTVYPQATDLRASGALLDPAEAALVATAVGLLTWHSHAKHCVRDGLPMSPTNAGWSRTCSSGHEEFPRTDPAVICLIHDGGDRVLLARGAAWSRNRYSALAGFVEVGESLEACVAREVHEEVGVDVTDIRYLGSQPWPFPRSLMLAFSAIADPSAPLTFHDGEIEAARWFTRDEVLASLERGDWTSPDNDELLVPPEISIARQMIAGWALGSQSG